MNSSNDVLLALILLLSIPVVAVGVLKLYFRKKGGTVPGWGGMLFIALCWTGALLLILHKSAH